VAMDGVAGAHIVADVGNGHQQAPPGAEACLCAVVNRHEEDGVVEIAGIFAVDRDEGHVAQIYPPTQVRGPYTVGQFAGLRHGSVGEFVRYAELAYRDLDLHTGVVDFAQNFYHASKRLRMACRLLHDLNRNDLTMIGAVDLMRVNQDVVLDALDFRHKDTTATC